MIIMSVTDDTIWSITLESSITILEASFKLIYDVYNTGIIYNAQHTLNYLNTNIYSYLETSGGQSYNIYLNAIHFFNNSVY